MSTSDDSNARHVCDLSDEQLSELIRYIRELVEAQKVKLWWHTRRVAHLETALDRLLEVGE